MHYFRSLLFNTDLASLKAYEISLSFVTRVGLFHFCLGQWDRRFMRYDARVSNFLGILCLILYECLLLFHAIFPEALEIYSDLLRDFRVFTGYFVRTSFVNFIFSDDLFDLTSV